MSYNLFAHAEILKDISQYFVGGYLTTSDLGQGVEGLTKVFAEEVATELHLESVDDALNTDVRAGKGFVMTGVGDDDIVVGEGGNVGRFVDGLLQLINALAKLCADGYKGMMGQGEVVDIAFVGLVSYNDKVLIFNTLKNVAYFFT